MRTRTVMTAKIAEVTMMSKAALLKRMVMNSVETKRNKKKKKRDLKKAETEKKTEKKMEQKTMMTPVTSTLPMPMTLTVMMMNQWRIHVALPAGTCWTGTKMARQMFAASVPKPRRGQTHVPLMRGLSATSVARLSTVPLTMPTAMR